MAHLYVIALPNEMRCHRMSYLWLLDEILLSAKLYVPVCSPGPVSYGRMTLCNMFNFEPTYVLYTNGHIFDSLSEYKMLI